MTDRHLYEQLKREWYAENPHASEQDIHRAMNRCEAMASGIETPGTDRHCKPDQAQRSPLSAYACGPLTGDAGDEADA